ncbi:MULTISPECIES: hypothetical protein [Spiroplasma]|uniref:Spiroplasmavirus-related protein n=2 Tax=Spiroplasma melliferum TaxID=2134 RepID=A0AAI9T2H1_SPIME|nr:hypothetical protein [Spiroplasma melliferum]UZQ30182.1 MAG: hypothetical protein OHM57_00560 [Spiroplasma phoeniceum]KAI92202.1 hypothetical protein SPM_005575 [Spiroplasma melliferum KC3]QCO23620.1 Spiroplasmavirus-related protein [Spiroplasma melliferum]UZQ30653.1 MAG: hypothetical protein OHM57_03205 [Spiroplasma phoeniceum]UZQ30911.1 MAG: hypothetical protein OHM57_04685 [Spiroplasma phoeniceum]
MNLLTETVTKIGFGDGMNSIWTGLGNAMGKVKDAVYGILPQLMTFLGDAWIILIPFGLFIIIKILNFFRHMVKGF